MAKPEHHAPLTSIRIRGETWKRVRFHISQRCSARQSMVHWYAPTQVATGVLLARQIGLNLRGRSVDQVAVHLTGHAVAKGLFELRMQCTDEMSWRDQHELVVGMVDTAFLQGIAPAFARSSPCSFDAMSYAVLSHDASCPCLIHPRWSIRRRLAPGRASGRIRKVRDFVQYRLMRPLFEEPGTCAICHQNPCVKHHRLRAFDGFQSSGCASSNLDAGQIRIDKGDDNQVDSITSVPFCAGGARHAMRWPSGLAWSSHLLAARARPPATPDPRADLPRVAPRAHWRRRCAMRTLRRR